MANLAKCTRALVVLSVSGAALFSSTAFAAKTLTEDEKRYFDISSVETKEVRPTSHFYAETPSNGQLTVVPNGIALGTCESTMSPYDVPGMDSLDPIGALDSAEVIVDKVINIGKKIWSIVQAGRPSVNIRSDVATALPQGTRCWMDLQTWQRPQSKLYKVAYKNGFGMEVVTFDYRVVWLPGGSFEGQGAYIGYATLVPKNVNVAWGFSLEAQASVPTVFNMGTATDPVGGMLLSMIYRVETAVKTNEQSQAFHIDGKGNFDLLD